MFRKEISIFMMDQLACAASENAIVPQDAAFLEEDPLRWLHILEVNMI